jgi:hypothetical protein
MRSIDLRHWKIVVRAAAQDRDPSESPLARPTDVMSELQREGESRATAQRGFQKAVPVIGQHSRFIASASVEDVR